MAPLAVGLPFGLVRRNVLERQAVVVHHNNDAVREGQAAVPLPRSSWSASQSGENPMHLKVARVAVPAVQVALAACASR